MQIFINNESIEVDTNNLINLSQLIQKVETSTLEPKQNFLTSIKLNNKLLDDQEEIDFAEYPIEKINNLELFASSPKDLIYDGLQLANTILPEMHKLISTILEYFEQNKTSEAYQEFQVITDGLMWFTTIFNGIEEHLLDNLKEKELTQHPFILNGNKLSGVFKTLIESQENSDQTLFLDLLEYDLLECIGLLSNSCNDFYQKVTQ
ncbi:MAG: hypothetical protein COB02_01580 [Candidatus Cloacimonadota bacterium]|nr:MAG: hypothetical protein COB02_01580 [Candidatus Cloacimonadota bacterium]